jgi:hypothetical protein
MALNGDSAPQLSQALTPRPVAQAAPFSRIEHHVPHDPRGPAKLKIFSI